MLSQIAKIELQVTYTCFISIYKHKLTYYMRITNETEINWNKVIITST